MKKLLGMIAVLLMIGASAVHAQEETGVGVTFFNAGKADAILIDTGSHYVLIDTGTNAFGKELVERLRETGIRTINVMLITHFDKDHVGGADKVLKEFDVLTVYQPDHPGDSKQYEQYEKALAKKGLVPDRLSSETAFTLDGVAFSVVPSAMRWTGEDNNEENDHSLITRMTAGNISFLFAGDAENARLSEMLRLGLDTADVLKVPHHGKPEKLSAAFFQAVQPRFAVITSSDEEPEDAALVQMLTAMGTQVYLTRQGTVRCETDGEEILFVQTQP